MNLLARYVARQVLAYVGLVMLVLLLLVGLYLFLVQSRDMGIGRFGLSEAILVTLCKLPMQAFTLLPVGALMGALLALGNLARGSELTIMRASGVSPFRLARWVACAGIALAAATWLIGDWVAPAAEQFADRYKVMAKTNQLAVPNGENLWAKDGNTFVFVERQTDIGELGGVYVMRFDEQRKLQSIGKAESAQIVAEQQWTLRNYVESRFSADQVTRHQQAAYPLSTRLSTDYLGAAAADPDTLSTRALYSYIHYLDKNHLQSDAWRTAFWSRIARTVALMVIVMLAVPFSIGPMRSTGMGARIVTGILVGAVFFLLARLLSNGGVVYDLDPLVIAWGPTAVLTLVTWIALARTR